MHECLEHFDARECSGPVDLYPALSGSGEAYPRCEAGYAAYVERVQPRLDAIQRDYPDSPFAPSWFDPAYAGESWDADY